MPERLRLLLVTKLCMEVMSGLQNMVNQKSFNIPKNGFNFFAINKTLGWRAIATPGEIYGYWEAFSKFGSGRVTWKDLIEPSIQLARNGLPISEYLGYVLKIKEKHF